GSPRACRDVATPSTSPRHLVAEPREPSMTSAKRTMTTAARVALSGLLVLAGVTPALAANFDGTKPLICAITTIMECDAGQCDRYAPEGTAVGAPSFIKIDVAT